jgi:homoserine kinase type II
MAHLARRGVRCPAPEPDRSGALFGMLNGKPAALLSRLDGRAEMSPSPGQCAAVGEALARLHLAAADYSGRLANRRGPAWWRQAARAVRAFVTADQYDLMVQELAHQSEFSSARLPRGAIHGDLFRDNVLWAPGEPPGIIDFGFAATDALAYDLAISVNDWCIERGGDGHGRLLPEHEREMIAGYHSVRPLTPEEQAVWPGLLRAAALRFWLSRLYDLHLPRPGDLVHAHDPGEFEMILRDRAGGTNRFPL